MAEKRGGATKPTLLLLGTNIIIVSHRLGVWDGLSKSIPVVVPSTVSGETRSFSLRPYIDSGAVRVETATQVEMEDFFAQFQPSFLQSLHAGEDEALALLLAGRLGECHFSTGDVPALHALVLMGLSERVVSLQTLLSSVGLGRRLPRQFTDGFLESVLDDGRRMRIQGLHLRKDSRLRLR